MGLPESLLRYSGIHTNKQFAGTIVFFTYILKDLHKRCGGNPFDNRNVLCHGTPDDNGGRHDRLLLHIARAKISFRGVSI